ncbi:MAG TPA: hypothetical protein VGS27_11005 [Candidatus Sulfotelmatobacter sp.]|nr:hypothetical protein [Candidatus Sulfotelmatobacter sp.]
MDEQHLTSPGATLGTALAPLATFSPTPFGMGSWEEEQASEARQRTSPLDGQSARTLKVAETIEQVAAYPFTVQLKPLEGISGDFERGWELGKRWALLRDELYSKFEAEKSVPYQQLVDFDRLIEDLAPLLEQYGSLYEKRLNWDYTAERDTFLEQVKNSWGLILLSRVHCKQCGKVATSEARGDISRYGNGFKQDGATALLNEGLCNACKESREQGASAGRG